MNVNAFCWFGKDHGRNYFHRNLLFFFFFIAICMFVGSVLAGFFLFFLLCELNKIPIKLQFNAAINNQPLRWWRYAKQQKCHTLTHKSFEREMAKCVKRMAICAYIFIMSTSEIVVISFQNFNFFFCCFCFWTNNNGNVIMTFSYTGFNTVFLLLL